MTSPALKSLYHDPEYYLESFKVFTSLSNKQGVLEDWMENVFGEAVVKKLRIEPPEREELRVLGIGSGSGRYH